ncbi:uncharacterized protein LOC128895564 [Hylaeus anthracinus]|uniref:uncharacterized protein LOC128895564 n=1 Tax=Hylaeus anthracinus TaxID=313031 RepID=UPI0023B98BBF|nr:uncharacterized protein LOC128895564 [Hylaeus anthracinus]XP_054014254.1 uncharacterized protein LOC128895564 [Hylaeus anthracinus]XP_054014255.1 uncharacterized protein LOC128895564 [Hylaeus anthracinus]XP_054014256.1 uncharacterized protein LOC128895564 [Hylaeus anthracinus]XP_054014257.1 uncharacterized protein LOC128895564 [Hylaeus anthracinus]
MGYMVALKNDVKMLRGRSILFVLFTNVILSIEGRTIQNRAPKFDSSTLKSLGDLDRSVDESMDGKIIEDPPLKREAVSSHHREESSAKKPKKRSDNSCPYGNKDMCLIFSLSKIANVQMAVPDQRSSDRSLMAKMFDASSKSSGIYEEEKPRHPSKERMDPPNVHCGAIRDVYIPEVKQYLPAFACTFGNNTFVLSSARFLQDRRRYLSINVNENTLENIKFAPKISRSNEVNVIPALLVLNGANNDYRIETRETGNEMSIRGRH